MEQNKTRSYLIYAFGEIFLVMVGILLALQINNWNEEKKFQEQIEVQLISLKKTLLTEQASLQRALNIHVFRYNAIQKYLELAGLETFKVTDGGGTTLEYEETWIWEHPLPDTYDRSFINKALTWTNRYLYFEANKNIIDEMSRNGMLTYLNSSELNDAINTYYGNVSFRFRDQYNFIFRDNWNAILLKQGILSLNPEQIEDPLSLIQDDPELAANLRMIAAGAGWLGNGAKVLLQDSQDLIDTINQKLEIE